MALNLIKFNDKPIFDIAPLVEPKITLKNEFKEVGKNIITKLVLTPSLREISLEYFIKDLSLARDFESFFISSCKGRLNSFYIPSFKDDFRVVGSFANTNTFNAKRQNSNFGIVKQALNIYIKDNSFFSKVRDIRVDTINNYEIVVLEDSFNFVIDENTHISQLILVRFKSDSFEIEKEKNIGYHIAFDLQEVIL